MAKSQKNAVQLADMIRMRLNEPKLRIAVYPKDGKGWYATAYTDPAIARDTQNRVDEAAEE